MKNLIAGMLMVLVTVSVYAADNKKTDVTCDSSKSTPFAELRAKFMGEGSREEGLREAMRDNTVPVACPPAEGNLGVTPFVKLRSTYMGEDSRDQELQDSRK